MVSRYCHLLLLSVSTWLYLGSVKKDLDRIFFTPYSQAHLAGRLLSAGVLGPLEQPGGLAAERQGEGERQRRPQLGHPRVEAAAGQAAARGRAGSHQGAHQGKQALIHHV